MARARERCSQSQASDRGAAASIIFVGSPPGDQQCLLLAIERQNRDAASEVTFAVLVGISDDRSQGVAKATGERFGLATCGARCKVVVHAVLDQLRGVEAPVATSVLFPRKAARWSVPQPEAIIAIAKNASSSAQPQIVIWRFERSAAMSFSSFPSRATLLRLRKKYPTRGHPQRIRGRTFFDEHAG